MGGGDDDQGDEDALHKVQPEEVAEHKVEEDLHRLLQDVENDKYEVSHAKKQLVDDEKNTGLLKCNNTRSFRNPSYEGHPHMRDSFPSYEVPFFQNFEFVKLFLSSKFKLH